jgi:hypothetical protein
MLIRHACGHRVRAALRDRHRATALVKIETGQRAEARQPERQLVKVRQPPASFPRLSERHASVYFFSAAHGPGVYPRERMWLRFPHLRSVSRHTLP